MDRYCNILLIEDRAEDALLLKRALQQKPGLNVVWHAKDGDEAIAYLDGSGAYSDRRTHPMPDLIILDLRLPNRNGFEVLEWLQTKTPRPRVGVFTISEDPSDERRAYELGADLFQTKTFEPAAIARFLHFLELLTCKTQDH
jgi:CheY-like chemotaxis protein